MNKVKELRTVSLCELIEIKDTLRLVANTLKSPQRETCLDRKVMRSWNSVSDMINQREPTASEALDYYMKKGQMPNIDD